MATTGSPVSADPSGTTGTYLVNEDQLGWGIELLKGKNIGLAAGAAAFTGPLFLLMLLLRRRRGRKKESP
jgi:hypothetical protein